jgi:hypothetical protein
MYGIYNNGLIMKLCYVGDYEVDITGLVYMDMVQGYNI